MKIKFQFYISVLAILVLTLVPIMAQAASSSPFVGHWQAIDVDGSDIRLTIGGPPNGPFQITWTESYITFCSGEAGIVRGTGVLNESDPYLLEAYLHVECFTTGESLDFDPVFRYHPTTNTLSARYDSGSVVIWHRPGQPQPAPLALNLRVNYGHDWVESFYEAGHIVWITVTESDGVTVRATAEVVSESKDFWGGETGFQTNPEDWDPEPPDIQTDDWVYAWMDNGASAQVRIGDIRGEVNISDDSIQGTISASWITDPVQVECLDWGSGAGPFDKDAGVIHTNGSETYFCSWEGEWDIQPGQDVGVGYFGPDGHWVANAFFVSPPPSPEIRAWLGNQRVEGYQWPLDEWITLEIYDSLSGDTFTASGQVEGDEWGSFIGFSLGDWILQPGQEITMAGAGIVKTHTILPVSITSVDPELDLVEGTASSEGMILLCIYDWACDPPAEAFADASGYWQVDYLDQFDIQPWYGMDATEFDEDGDGTSFDFWIPNP